MDEYPLYLTVQKAAEYAGIGRDAMYDYVNSADPPPMLELGQKHYIEREGLAAYLRGKQVTSARGGRAVRRMRSA